ncbi:MAG: prepilin-type N-terminal cleavage/methylation domain-containing protein [Candidatus Paceibacterota bacterium]
MKKDISTKKGFTLIELLVVISIIGLLSSIIIPAISTARMKSRDAKRVGDVKQLQIALEFYRDKFGTYPTSCDSGGFSWCHYCGNPHGINDGLQILVTEGFMSEIPEDPIASGRTSCYNYEYISAPGQNSSWGCYVNGTWKSISDYPYVIRFESEATRFKLPTFQWARSPAGEYCILGPQ